MEKERTNEPHKTWIALEDEKPKDGQLIAFACLPNRSTPKAPVFYGALYYPEPPLTDVMDFWMPLPEIER